MKTARKRTDSPDLNEEIKKIRELLQALASFGIPTTTPPTPAKKSKSKKRGRPKTEPKMNFCLYMPYKLYHQLKNYLEIYGEKGETMASIIIAGTEKELKERIAKKLLQIRLQELEEIPDSQKSA